MTEEEINKKAEKHCNEVLCNAHEKCNEVIKCRDWRSRRAGFFCGYEQALKDCEKENAELKARVGLSIDCEKAQKNGELCLGYGGDEDEPCERCKNCIKCECGYYQLGETEKDDQLTKAKELLNEFNRVLKEHNLYHNDLYKRTEQFISEVKE